VNTFPSALGPRSTANVTYRKSHRFEGLYEAEGGLGCGFRTRCGGVCKGGGVSSAISLGVCTAVEILRVCQIYSSQFAFAFRGPTFGAGFTKQTIVVLVGRGMVLTLASLGEVGFCGVDRRMIRMTVKVKAIPVDFG
jgi:hypothetical protein